MPESVHFITVVIPVRNESRFIRSTLEQLLAQDYPSDRFEIIVADGMSDDGTNDLVSIISSMHNNIRLEPNPGRLSSAGRNVGFRLGRGDVFLVIDGHCHIPSRNLLSDVARCFCETGADCLGRPQPLDPPGLTPFQEAIALARSSWLGHGGGSLIYGDHEGFLSPVSNGAAYRREVFERVGYVDESFDACEDVEFNWRVERAGLRSYTSPRLMVKYYPRESLGGLWKQMLRYGRGRYRLFRKHPDTLTLSTLVPPLFVLAMAVCISLALAAVLAGHQTVAFVLLLPLAAYAFVAAAESLRIGLGKGPSLWTTLPAIFATIHVGLGTGFITGAAEALRSWRGKP